MRDITKDVVAVAIPHADSVARSSPARTPTDIGMTVRLFAGSTALLTNWIAEKLILV